MPDELGERTEEATPRRLQEAREEGNVAKSSDAAGAIMLLGVTILLYAALVPTLAGMGALVESMLTANSPALATHDETAIALCREAFDWTVRLGLPILLIMWGIGYLSHFWQIGWLFSAKSIQPKLSKLDPIAGFKRIAGLSALMKAAMDSSKVAIVVLIAAITIAQMFDRLILLPQMELLAALEDAGWMLFDLALRIVAALLILGLLDFAWQRFKHKRDLRMTKTEVREELKETEGDPEVRKRRMRIQQQIAMQRVSAAVPRADVVVTNPEHISIAIQYDEETMHAPRVVAKGQDHIALRIRQIAMKHGIPIVERKPLARALHRDVEVGHEIPPDFYQAVAEILAYVYRLNERAAS